MKPGKNSTSLRRDNLRLLLERILAAPSGLSRAQLAEDTGLTRATVSRLADELVNAGVVAELKPVRQKMGRPAAPLAAKHDHMILAVEINIAYIATVAMDLAGNVVSRRRLAADSRQSDPEKVLSWVAQIAAAERDNLPAGNLLGVALCIPGLVTRSEFSVDGLGGAPADTEAGRASSYREENREPHTILTAPNLGWRDVNPTPFFAARGFDPERLWVFNEADAAACSVLYSRPGVKAESDNFVYISGEVGVGAALVTDGELFFGDHGWAGEIGHMCVDRGGPKCRCGSNGCLEQYAGADSIIRNAGLAGQVTDIDRIVELFDDGDPAARQSIDLCATALGTTISNILNFLDLREVVLGGNLGRLYGRMEMIMAAEIEYRVLGRRWHDVQIEVNPHGDFAAARGACLGMFAKLVAEPRSWQALGIPIEFLEG